jgi:PPOX class probable F420-dependent enzyme
LSSDEAWAVLASAHTGVLTTLRSDGFPISLPVWFVAHDRRIYSSTPARTKKVARIGRDPRVAFLVESGERWVELRAVHLTGRAHVVDDPATAAPFHALLEEKYRGFRPSRDALPDKSRQYYEAGRALIEIVPDERILTWDNSRLELGS